MFFLFGLLVGFLASVPPGPINIYSISQALRFGFWQSVSIRFTVAILDAVYCYLCIVFTSLLVSFLDRWAFTLRLAGTAAIIAAGSHLLHLARTHRSLGLGLPANANNSDTQNKIEPPRRVSPPIIFTTLMYVSSPTLPVFWLTIGAIFTSHGLVTHHGLRPVLFSLACGLGSLIYYMVVAKIGGQLQKTMKPKFFETAYLVMAIILYLLAAFSLLSFFLFPHQGGIGF